MFFSPPVVFHDDLFVSCKVSLSVSAFSFCYRPKIINAQLMDHFNIIRMTKTMQKRRLYLDGVLTEQFGNSLQLLWFTLHQLLNCN